MTSSAGFLDNERLQFDRLTRFLVCATERKGSRFSQFGLLGRLQRIGWQAGRSSEDVEAEIWRRRQSYLALMQRNPAAFWATTDQLIDAYGEATLRRWRVLKD